MQEQPTCENDVSSNFTFAQGSDDENIFNDHVYELKHSDSQKAYGFGYLADKTTDKMN